MTIDDKITDEKVQNNINGEAARIISIQGHSDGTSSVSFEVLIISLQIYFISLFIVCCLTLNINFFIFNLLMLNSCFPKIISFTNRREQLFMNAPSQFRDFKLAQKNDDLLSLKLLRYRTLCKGILRCGFPRTGIKLTPSVFFEEFRVPQL